MILPMSGIIPRSQLKWDTKRFGINYAPFISLNCCSSLKLILIIMNH